MQSNDPIFHLENHTKQAVGHTQDTADGVALTPPYPPAVPRMVGPTCDEDLARTTLSCHGGSAIGPITFAFYGRADTSTCPYPNAGAMTDT